jgi:thiol-disulfide isomerase/thioredoxin
MFASTRSNSLRSPPATHYQPSHDRIVRMRPHPPIGPTAWLAVLAITLLAGTTHDALAADRAPEFTHASASHWLNSTPLKLKDLRGQIVLIEFWAFECINCRRTVPWMHSMQERFGDRGLVIVGVHTPELPQERAAVNVRAAVQEQNITYPVMLDDDYSYWNALDNRYWPAFYVVDGRGEIAARAVGEMHVGQRRALEFEQQIEQLLRARRASMVQ